jgi:hypothetical protein
LEIPRRDGSGSRPPCFGAGSGIWWFDRSCRSGNPSSDAVTVALSIGGGGFCGGAGSHRKCSMGSRFGAHWFGCCLFFVRVNQVLVRLWARCQGKGGSIAIFSPKSQSLTGTCVSWRRGMWRPATAANAFKDVGISVC